jgi:hypothetical protein
MIRWHLLVLFHKSGDPLRYRQRSAYRTGYGCYFKSHFYRLVGLHILSGGMTQSKPMVTGHEFMEIVEEVGKGVTKLKSATEWWFLFLLLLTRNIFFREFSLL